ncbi:MAG: anti-sigma factor [Terriglobia bacterium]
MNDHPQPDAVFDEYALGVLEGDDLLRLQTHLKACAECQRKAQEARARTSLLGVAAPLATPPPAARQRLLESLRPAAPPLDSAPIHVFERPRRDRRTWGIGALAAAAIALACLAAFLLVRNHDLRMRLEASRSSQQQSQAAARRQQSSVTKARAVMDVLTSPSTMTVSLAALRTHPVPEGKAFYNAEKGLVFYAANLPSLPADRIYQLWLLPSKGKPVNAGIFETDKSGNGQVLLPPLPRGVSAKAFAVTIEPEGGRPQPTGKMVLMGAAS